MVIFIAYIRRKCQHFWRNYKLVFYNYYIFLTVKKYTRVLIIIYYYYCRTCFIIVLFLFIIKATYEYIHCVFYYNIILYCLLIFNHYLCVYTLIHNRLVVTCVGKSFCFIKNAEKVQLWPHVDFRSSESSEFVIMHVINLIPCTVNTIETLVYQRNIRLNAFFAHRFGQIIL